MEPAYFLHRIKQFTCVLTRYCVQLNPVHTCILMLQFITCVLMLQFINFAVCQFCALMLQVVYVVVYQYLHIDGPVGKPLLTVLWLHF